MRIYLSLASILLACGPTGPTLESTTGTSDGPSGTTASPPDPTTTAPTTADHNDDTSSSADISTAAITSSSGGVMPALDEGSIVDCDIFAQDCPAGQKCAAHDADGGGTWNATKCVPVTGDGAPGEPCTVIDGPVSGLDDCAFGSMCWEVDENDHGTCFALCTGSERDPICPPAHFCPLSGDGLLNLCTPICDPLVGECPGSDLCIPGGDTFFCVFDASGDEGQLNDPCEFVNVCDPGLVCLDAGAASSACDAGSLGCCQPFCHFPDAACPNPDQQCVPWFDPRMDIPPGFEDVGVCAIPP
jgi:hypothetical protein